MYEMAGDFTHQYFNYADPILMLEIAVGYRKNPIIRNHGPYPNISRMQYRERPNIGNDHTYACPYVKQYTLGGYGSFLFSDILCAVPAIPRYMR